MIMSYYPDEPADIRVVVMVCKEKCGISVHITNQLSDSGTLRFASWNDQHCGTSCCSSSQTIVGVMISIQEHSILPIFRHHCAYSRRSGGLFVSVCMCVSTYASFHATIVIILKSCTLARPSPCSYTCNLSLSLALALALSLCHYSQIMWHP